MVESHVLRIIFLFCGFLTIFAGVTCWVIGVLNPTYFQSYALISIPIFPTTDDAFSYYIGINTSLSQIVHPLESLTDLIIPFKLFNYSSQFSAQSSNIHILHNFWGYNFNVTIQEEGETKLIFGEEHNINIGDSDSPLHPTFDPIDLPQSLREYGDFRVYCPYSTLVTSEIDPYCKREYGSFFSLKEPLEDVVIGSMSFPNINAERKIIFHDLKVLPNDFVSVPQMFVGVWVESFFRRLIFAGYILTCIGILVVMITVAVFFACFVTP